MASDSIGFVILMVGIALSGFLLYDAAVGTVEEISDAEKSLQEESLERENTELELTDSVYFSGNQTLIVRINNIGSEPVSLDTSSIVFENELASPDTQFTFKSSSVTPNTEINTAPYPTERTAIPPGGQLRSEFVFSSAGIIPDRVKFITLRGLSYSKVVTNG